METTYPVYPKFHALDNFDDLPPHCREDFAALAALSFDLDLAWFQHLIRHSLRKGEIPRLYLVESEGGARVWLPACIRKTGFGGVHVDALVSFYSTFYAPVLPAAGAEALLQFLFRRLRDTQPGLSELRFYPMDPDSREFAGLFAGLRASGLIPFRYYCFGNWYLSCRGMAWEQYLKTRTKKMRSNIKRAEKQFLEARGKFALITHGESALETAIAGYDLVYRSSWKSEEAFPEFVPGLIRMASAAGWLRLGLAYLEEKPVAAQIWLVCHGKACIYKVAYDENHSRLSPGTALTAYMLKHVLENEGVAEVDYLVGDDSYKKTWMSHRRERWGIVAYNPSNFFGMAGIGRQWAGILYKQAKGFVQSWKPAFQQNLRRISPDS